MKYTHILCLIIIITLSHLTHQTTITLPVSQQIITKLSLSIQKLQQLLKYFNTRYQNKVQIYKRVQLTKRYLDQLRKALCQYNNVIAGGANSVDGNKNVVIGNYNNIKGSNNWVFISKFTGTINGDLLISDWRIQLEKSNLILINPKLAISYIDQERNKKMNHKYRNKDREFCQFGKWAHSENKKNDQHWSRYKGYSDWKTSNSNKKNHLKSQPISGSWQRTDDYSKNSNNGGKLITVGMESRKVDGESD